MSQPTREDMERLSTPVEPPRLLRLLLVAMAALSVARVVAALAR